MTNNITEKEFESNFPLASKNGKDFLLKYCSTCKIVRELRVFHCSNCNACISRHGKKFN